MDKIILLLGKEETGTKRIESYQLLIGQEYKEREISIEIPYSISDLVCYRRSIFEETTDVFTEMLLKVRSSYLLGVYNGLRICSEDNIRKIPRLEDSIAREFQEMLTYKVLQANPKCIPVPSMN